MRKGILAKWMGGHWLSLFFQDFPSWLETVPQYTGLLGVQIPETAASTGILQEYDDLFKGTDAAVYIPLWASACKGCGDMLLDETTLDVLRSYREWGYRAVEMDGNPPDYIGQMLRFLCYLSACMLHGLECGKPIWDLEQAGERFVQLYLADTARAVAEGIKRHARHPLFHALADNLLDYTRGAAVGWTEGQWAEAEVLSPRFACHDRVENGPFPAIPIGEAHVVNTAGRNNCGGKCVIRATVQEGCVLRLGTDCGLGDPPLRACARGREYHRTYLSGRRLRYPMQRVGARGEGKFRRISWEEAAAIVAGEWARIRDTYGPGARYVHYSTGVSAVLRPDSLAKRLLSLDGGYLGYYNSYSTACTRYTTPYIYGDDCSGNSMEDIRNTKLLLLWGHNPAETVFGSQRNSYIAKARKNGARVIVIDPRRSDTAVAFADEWIGIRPSTDGALADAMAYIIWSEGLLDRRFMDTYCIGFDEAHLPEGAPVGGSYESYLFGRQDGIPKTPRWAEQITGIPAERIADLAREYATTKPACLLPGFGNQRIGNGEQTVRAMAMLTCLTGNVGIPGGGAAGAGAVREHALPAYPVPPNPYPGKIPCFLWTKAMEHARDMTRREDGLEGVPRLDTDIKMIVNLAGNTLVNQHADINNTIRILRDTGRCEFILCSDVFMTPSARFADILLPAPSFLEDDNIAPPWEYGHYLLCNNKVIEPLFGCEFEYELLRMVAARLGLEERWSLGRRSHTEWLEPLYNALREKEPELPPYDRFKRDGGYHYQNAKPYIAYEAQIRDPQGHPFATPSGKIEIYSQRLFDLGRPEEIPAIPRYVPCAEGPADSRVRTYPLQLIGWHTKRRCHSIHDNNQWMEKLEPQSVWIHPDDACARGIGDGEVVEVYNDRGRMRIPAHVTTRIVKGAVAIPQGAWYTPDAKGADTRGSINILTSTHPTPLAKGNSQHTALVEVVKTAQ